jgi:shikimate kinase
MEQGASIFLVGLMGAGKTTVGRLLARRLGCRFVDADVEIERRCGVKIPVIFEIEGEAGFRARERAVIAELSAETGIVLATGGGAVMDPDTRADLAQRGLVLYLHAQPRDLYFRTRHDKNRPLLANAPDALAKLTELYAARDPLYRAVADRIIDTGPQGVQVLMRQVLSELPEPWHQSA